jgi:hypothetical protein
MRGFLKARAAVVVLGLITVAGVVRAADTLIADEQPSHDVTVRDVTTRRGAVSGVLVSHSRKVLRDVRLLVHHTWLWKDELKPGDDSPGRVDYYTVRSTLPSGASVDFTYRPEPPLPDREDGHFETTVDVVGWTEIGR